MLACSFKAARDAFPQSKWPRAVRIGQSGSVLEPASGSFDVTVAPGQAVQAALDACPAGGSVLLLPGTHEGPLVLPADKEVHVFGRGKATLRTAAGTVLTSESKVATVDGLTVRCEAPFDLEDVGDDAEELFEPDIGVWIKGGRLRLQGSDVVSTSVSGTCVRIEGGADPQLASCKCARRLFRGHIGLDHTCTLRLKACRYVPYYLGIRLAFWPYLIRASPAPPPAVIAAKP